MNIENLKQAREAAHFTQMQAANALEISDGTYKNYEQGKREPNNTLLLKIADLYGVTTDYLLGREPAQPEPNPFADLGLDKESEQDMLAQYMSFPPEMRAILMDALVRLASAVKPDEPETIRQSTMIDCGTIGEELARRQQEAEALRKDTA